MSLPAVSLIMVTFKMEFDVIFFQSVQVFFFFSLKDLKVYFFFLFLQGRQS